MSLHQLLSFFPSWCAREYLLAYLDIAGNIMCCWSAHRLLLNFNYLLANDLAKMELRQVVQVLPV